jgi:hypothetical protein
MKTPTLIKISGVLALLLVMTGCTITTHIPAEAAFVPAPKVNAIHITWIAAADPTAECKRQFPRTMGFHPMIPACAGWDDQQTVCVVVTGTPTTHQILGHEMRHCFEGHFHD